MNNIISLLSYVNNNYYYSKKINVLALKLLPEAKTKKRQIIKIKT